MSLNRDCTVCTQVVGCNTKYIFIVTYKGLNNELSGVYLVRRYFFLFLKLMVFILLIAMILFEKHVLLETAKILDETMPVFQEILQVG